MVSAQWLAVSFLLGIVVAKFVQKTGTPQSIRDAYEEGIRTGRRIEIEKSKDQEQMEGE